MRDIEGIERVMAKLEPRWPDVMKHFEAENDRFKMLMAQDHDLIGRVLKCHLVVEYYLDRFILDHFGLEDLSQAKLHFHQKAQLLPDRAEAAAFVKPGILRLNAIRNQFGHTLDPALSFDHLGAMREVLHIAREGARFSSPIKAIEAFTTVACTWLVIPPKNFQKLFQDAFSEIALAPRVTERAAALP